MVWVQVGVSVIALGVAVFAGWTVRQARRELRQVRLLFGQMEDDHAVFVRQHLAWRRSVKA